MKTFCKYIVLVVGMLSFAGQVASAESVEDTKQAAQRGDVESQYELAHRYQAGRGVEQDFSAATRWYINPAEK